MNRGKWFVDRFRSSVKKVANAELFIFALNQSMMPVIETVAVFGMLLVTLILLWQGKNATSIISALVLFSIAIIRIMPSLSKLITNYNTLKYHSYAISSISDDLIKLDGQSKHKDEEFGVDKSGINFKSNIKLDRVSYAYPETSQLVLNNVSLTIPKNTAVGLVGSSGSGKTTIVDLILGLLDLDNGVITVDGVDIRTKICGWRKTIGYIPQFIYLLDNTIRNNIALGLDEKDINETQILNAVKVAQLDGLVSRLPQGLDTVVGERGVRLSGGERQRVGIARALYHNPEVLIMDEATSSLDNQTERYIIEAIERLKKDRTIIIIAHRLATIKNCDVLHLLKNGSVVASGSYEELLSKSDDFRTISDA